jgi:glycosyltransferase involved in cell wall biosynthesis
MSKNKRRVAIVHDVFIEQGGAERVLLRLLSLYPGADVSAPLITPKARRLLKKAGAGTIVTSPFNSLPLVHSASILLKPVLFLYWQTLNFSGYDLVISSSHSFSSKAVRTPAHALHISYIHTSPRYLYDEYSETRILKNPLMKGVLWPLLAWLRAQDFAAAQRPDVLVANSRAVARRIRKYYGRSSVVIHPPVLLPKRVPKRLPLDQQYYLCFSRLASQKGIDLAVRACTQLGRPLKVVGEGSERAYLESIAGPTVQFLGRVPDKQLAKIFTGARAMIYPAIEEDFGMAPVEAMGYGVPIIAHRSGGTKETVIEGKTGIFFDEWTVAGVGRAIEQFERRRFSPAACRRQAEHFSAAHFDRQFRALVKQEEGRRHG